MITERLLATLLEPIDESITLLQKIDAKLDAQASSKLSGAFDSLKRVRASKKSDETTLKIALSSLTESSRYFKTMAEHTISKMEGQWQWQGPKGLIKFWAFVINTFRDVSRFGGGSINHIATLELEALNYATLFMLSEAGKIICMQELRYSAGQVDQEYTKLQSFRLRFSESEMNWFHDTTWSAFILPAARKKGAIPAIVWRMSPDLSSFDEFLLSEYKKLSVPDRFLARFFNVAKALDTATLGRLTEAYFRYVYFRIEIEGSRNATTFFGSLAKSDIAGRWKT